MREFCDQAYNHHGYAFKYVDPAIDYESMARVFARLNSSREPIVFFGEQQDHSDTKSVSAVEHKGSAFFFNSLVPAMVAKDYGEQRLTFLLPLQFLMDNNDFRLHVVMFAQLRASAKAHGSLHENPFYLSPCMPVKTIDQTKINTDFANSLQMMYYN